MIYSAATDNWLRIKIMHSMAKSYYEKTRDSEYRMHRLTPSEELYFDADDYDSMEKETCIVGLIMAWSVLTLESLVNHVLAEVINNRDMAILAIEYPSKIIEIVKSFPFKSDLAKKLRILGGQETPHEVLKLAEDLSKKRNAIVHDKPFDLICTEEGEEIEHYRIRGESENDVIWFEHLDGFYKECKKICDYVEQFHYVISPMGDDVDFGSLICMG